MCLYVCMVSKVNGQLVWATSGGVCHIRQTMNAFLHMFFSSQVSKPRHVPFCLMLDLFQARSTRQTVPGFAAREPSFVHYSTRMYQVLKIGTMGVRLCLLHFTDAGGTMRWQVNHGVSFNNFMEKYMLLFSLPSAAATASLGMSDWVILVS
jgi:hypothetical protein